MAIRLRAVTADNFDVISELPLLPPAARLSDQQ